MNDKLYYYIVLCCIGRTTLPPLPEADMTFIWGLLAFLASVATVFWCCWRPGFIPWRLARLRNLKIGGKLPFEACKKMSICKNGLCGPREGIFKNCCKSCVGTGSDGPSAGVWPKTGTGTDTQDTGCCGSRNRPVRSRSKGISFPSTLESI